MTILKRLRNLWQLSSWEPSSEMLEKTASVGTKFTTLTQKPKMAQIIRRESPTKKVLKDE